MSRGSNKNCKRKYLVGINDYIITSFVSTYK